MNELNNYKAICKCGNIFTPRWLNGIKMISKVCGTCAEKNLINLIEEEDHADTIEDISRNEQCGAKLRDIFNIKNP